MGGALEVGDHVKIMHRGISSEEPTVIRTAFSLDKGEFVFEENEAAEDDPTKPTATPEPHVLE